MPPYAPRPALPVPEMRSCTPGTTAGRALAGLTFGVFIPLLVAMAGCGRTGEARADEGRTLSSAALQAGPAFVQVNYATPQTPMVAVSVPFTAAQSAGNLNVVVVGWNDTTASVASVSDTSGNTYTPAAGPTAQPGAVSQSIYYAKGIASAPAGANVVTVSFTVPAQFADIRVLE